MNLLEVIGQLSDKVTLKQAKKAFLKRAIDSLRSDESLHKDELKEEIDSLLNQVLDIETWLDFQAVCYEYNDDDSEDFDNWILELAE